MIPTPGHRPGPSGTARYAAMYPGSGSHGSSTVASAYPAPCSESVSHRREITASAARPMRRIQAGCGAGRTPLQVAASLTSGSGDLAGYDAFVIGSAAYELHWRKEATEFMRRTEICASAVTTSSSARWSPGS